MVAYTGETRPEFPGLLANMLGYEQLPKIKSKSTTTYTH